MQSGVSYYLPQTNYVLELHFLPLGTVHVHYRFPTSNGMYSTEEKNRWKDNKTLECDMSQQADQEC